MFALVTGASSGIGFEIAKYLSALGYDIIAVARNRERLEKLKREATTNVEVIVVDLGIEQNCIDLFNEVSGMDIEVVVNDAGFGLYGNFWETDLNRELYMIRTNISALHILTKLFLQKMLRYDKGYIMNVGSLAGFMPGPHMATYYATKAYVNRLTQAIQVELGVIKTNVTVSLLCPGPVATGFEEVANVEFAMKQQSPRFVAQYAVERMFRGDRLILPGASTKLIKWLSKVSPDYLNARAADALQHKKN